MIVDSSALVAILRGEPEAPAFLAALTQAGGAMMSAASYLETAIVIDRGPDPALSRRLDEFLSQSAIAIEPVTVHQAKLAREAYRDFGKGSGHPAALNFGDCFSYALAHEKSAPLLFKGTDFDRTNLKPAL